MEQHVVTQVVDGAVTAAAWPSGPKGERYACGYGT